MGDAREQVAVRIASVGMQQIREIAAKQNATVSDVIRLAIKHGLADAESELKRRSVTI